MPPEVSQLLVPGINADPAEVMAFITNTRRPVSFDAQGRAYDAQGLRINSFLNREEWEKLDKAVITMVRQRLNIVEDIMGAGLVKRTTLAEAYSKWRVASERIAADVTMDFRTRLNQDRTDKYTYGVPVPLISSMFTIGRRELIIQRAHGTDIQTFEAEEAGEAVAERIEDIVLNGETGIVVQGNSIPGLRTLAARDTATAAGYGGGDFGTITNIRATFLGMISALAAKRYYGPFNCYIANTQYNEMLARYTDGSGQTALETVEELPQIQSVKPNDLMPDGNLVMVQMTSNVVDLLIAQDFENREWMAPDDSALFYIVLASMVPRLKTDYEGNAGIAHATAC